MPKQDSDEVVSINTGGGAFIGGNVSTGGDFIGGDQITISGSGNVIAGSSIRGVLRSQTETYLYSELRERLVKSFSLEELEVLSFNFGADWDSLSGDSLNTKARSLIAYALRRGKLDEFIRECARIRPNIDWNILPSQDLNQVIKETDVQAPDHLRIFLAYASSDAKMVRVLYQRLRNDGFDVWLDSEDLVTGQDWSDAITEALRTSDVIVFVLSQEATYSKSASDTLDFVLEQYSGNRHGSIFIIPLLLQPTELPEALKGFQAVNYFEEKGYRDLVRALRASAANLGVVPTTGQ